MIAGGTRSYERMPGRWRRVRVARPRATSRRARIWFNCRATPSYARLERRMAAPLLNAKTFTALMSALAVFVFVLGTAAHPARDTAPGLHLAAGKLAISAAAPHGIAR